MLKIIHTIISGVAKTKYKKFYFCHLLPFAKVVQICYRYSSKNDRLAQYNRTNI